VTVRVPLQRADGPATAADAKNDIHDDSSDKGASMHQLGVSVTPLDAQTAKQLGVPADVKGLVVMGTQDGTSAANHLLTPDEGGPDIILSVEGKAVETPEQLKAALQNVKSGEIVSLSVYNAQAKSRRIERVKVGASE
jgi:S1-C subfamily serine protease